MAEASSPLSLGIPRDPLGELKPISAEEFAEALIQAGGVNLEAARALGCNPERVCAARSQHPGVEQAAQDGWRYVRDEAKGQLIRGVQRGQLQAIAFFLKTDSGADGGGEAIDAGTLLDVPPNHR
jgi:hypothetical protein